MGTLLDTHALIWWVERDERITPALRQRLDNPDEDVFVSAASAWEIATKVRLGKLRLARCAAAEFPAGGRGFGISGAPHLVAAWL